jgi:hypothetical protein
MARPLSSSFSSEQRRRPNDHKKKPPKSTGTSPQNCILSEKMCYTFHVDFLSSRSYPGAIRRFPVGAGSGVFYSASRAKPSESAISPGSMPKKSAYLETSFGKRASFRFSCLKIREK